MRVEPCTMALTVYVTENNTRRYALCSGMLASSGWNPSTTTPILMRQVASKPRSQTIHNIYTAWKRPRNDLKRESTLRVSQVCIQRFWGCVEAVVAARREFCKTLRKSLRDLLATRLTHGVCAGCLSLSRVTHNKLETAIPLSTSICCCSQE